MKRWFLGSLVLCGLALGPLGCASPRQGGETAATARTITEAAREVTQAIDSAFAELARRRVADGLSPDGAMTGQDWVYVGFQVGAVVAKYVAEFQVSAVATE